MSTSTQSNSNTKPKSARLSSTSEKHNTPVYANLNFETNRKGKSKSYTRKETPVTYATINPETTIYETIIPPKPPSYDRIDNRHTSNITAVKPASNTPKQQQNVRSQFDIPNVEKKKFPGFNVRKLFGTRKQKRDTPKPANQESAKLPWWKRMFGKEKKTKKIQSEKTNPIYAEPILNSEPVSIIPTESQTSSVVPSKKGSRRIASSAPYSGVYAKVKKRSSPPLPERKYRHRHTLLYALEEYDRELGKESEIKKNNESYNILAKKLGFVNENRQKTNMLRIIIKLYDENQNDLAKFKILPLNENDYIELCRIFYNKYNGHGDVKDLIRYCETVIQPQASTEKQSALNEQKVSVNVEPIYGELPPTKPPVPPKPTNLLPKKANHSQIEKAKNNMPPIPPPRRRRKKEERKLTAATVKEVSVNPPRFKIPPPPTDPPPNNVSIKKKSNNVKGIVADRRAFFTKKKSSSVNGQSTAKLTRYINPNLQARMKIFEKLGTK